MPAMKSVNLSDIRDAYKKWDVYLKLLGVGNEPYLVWDVDPTACIAIGKGPEHYRMTDKDIIQQRRRYIEGQRESKCVLPDE